MKGKILVNFKIYKESFGDGAIKLANICKKIMEETDVEIIPVVSVIDVFRISKEVGIKVYVQHVDEYMEGAKNGYISPIQCQEAGAGGALINHSEHKIKTGTIKKMVKNWPKNFDCVLCVQTLGQVENWANKLKVTMVAYEPKDLIGNREKSVASEKGGVIKKISEMYGEIPVLAGAGIHCEEDVKVSLKMGAKGVLVATDVVKAENPEKELEKLAKVFI